MDVPALISNDLNAYRVMCGQTIVSVIKVHEFRRQLFSFQIVQAADDNVYVSLDSLEGYANRAGILGPAQNSW